MKKIWYFVPQDVIEGVFVLGLFLFPLLLNDALLYFEGYLFPVIPSREEEWSTRGPPPWRRSLWKPERDGWVSTEETFSLRGIHWPPNLSSLLSTIVSGGVQDGLGFSSSEDLTRDGIRFAERGNLSDPNGNPTPLYNRLCGCLEFGTKGQRIRSILGL